ncbi:M15 family metallopeptidase [Streptomyces scopuliridis]|uniref:M15 family metallopeptidase n=1 Tax=Streptomyces scopuliridis TaxID=452529 RepID=UPI0036CC9628
MSQIILMSDPKVAAIPVRECGACLADLRLDGRLLVDPRKQDDSDSFFFLREGVLERLCRAQAELPGDLRLLVVEGYRPPELQRRYFEDYSAELRAEQPGWSEEQLRTATSRFVSPPEIAPHSAGAAVDLTLADADGNELDLGTPMNATPEESAGACYSDAAAIDGQARGNREILGSVLRAADFVNYPTEWWHWSFGDRYWALVTGAAAACYGPRGRDGQGCP